MIWITKAKYLKDYQIEIKFNNGERMCVDLKNHLKEGIFKELKDLKLFSTVKLNSDLDTIAWDNGADLAPEFLYQLGKKQNRAA